MTDQNVIVIQGKDEKLDPFDLNYIIIMTAVTIGGSLISLILFNFCGIKSALKKAYRKKPYTIDKIERHEEMRRENEDIENGAAASEVAAGGWQKLSNKSKFVHAPTLSVHSHGPLEHHEEEVCAGKSSERTKSIVCPHACRAVGNRYFNNRGQQTYLWVHLTVITIISLLGSVNSFSYVETHNALIDISPNSQNFNTSKEYFFAPDPEVPALESVNIVWCRGIPMIESLPTHQSCDDRSSFGVFAALILGKCTASIFYQPATKGFSTNTATSHPDNAVCGHVLIEVLEGMNGTAYVLSSKAIENHAWGVTTKKMSHVRNKRVISFGDGVVACFGGGGGFGFVAVTVVCDNSGILAPFQDAINSLFNTAERTLELLDDTQEWASDHFDELYQTDKIHTRRIYEVSTTSAYNTIFSMQSNAMAEYASLLNAFGLKRRQIMEDRDRKRKMQSELDDLSAGQRSGEILAALAHQIHLNSPTITPQIVLGTDLCDIEVAFYYNNTYLKYAIAVECPTDITTKKIQIEVHPRYCVRVDTKCRCQNFRMVMYDSGSTAQFTDSRDAESLLWPFNSRAQSVSLTWESTGTTVPNTAVTVADNTFQSVREVCPPAVIILGNWGTLIHCGLTCLFSKLGRSVTNMIIYDDRLEVQSLTGAGMNKRIPKRLTNNEVTVLTSTASLITTSQTGKYEADTNTYKFLQASEQENEQMESVVMAIQTNREEMLESAQNLRDQSQDIIAENAAARRKFNESLKSMGTTNYILVGLALFISVAALVSAIIALCCIYRKFRTVQGLKETGNMGFQNTYNLWMDPSEFRCGMELLGMIMRDGTYYDAEKNALTSFAVKFSLRTPIIRQFVCEAICVKSSWPGTEYVYESVSFREEEEPNAGAIGGSSVNMRVIPHQDFKRKAAIAKYRITGDNSDWVEKGAHWWNGDWKLTRDQMNQIMSDHTAYVKFTHPYTIILSEGNTIMANRA